MLALARAKLLAKGAVLGLEAQATMLALSNEVVE